VARRYAPTGTGLAQKQRLTERGHAAHVQQWTAIAGALGLRRAPNGGGQGRTKWALSQVRSQWPDQIERSGARSPSGRLITRGTVRPPGSGTVSVRQEDGRQGEALTYKRQDHCYPRLVKLLSWDDLIDNGFSQTTEFRTVERHIKKGIRLITWPPGSNTFTIYAQSGKKRGQGNGVKPIKDAFVAHLRDNGWEPEYRRFDAHYTFPAQSNTAPFVVEWETGNISSSHRSINRMVKGMLESEVSGGVLIVPSRAMYRYLTDRVGNAKELEPYHALWRSWSHHRGVGYLAIITVEHDYESLDVPRITKGTDGRALL
jgi:Restriction endonuclease BamHI